MKMASIFTYHNIERLFLNDKSFVIRWPHKDASDLAWSFI